MIKPRFTWGLLTTALILGAAVSCGDDEADPTNTNTGGDGDGDGDGDPGDGDPETDAGGEGGTGGTNGDGDVDGGNQAGSGGTDGGGGAPAGCPDIADRTVVEVDTEISGDTTWTCDNLYVLVDLTFVMDNSVLTVEPGTVVQGDLGSALVVTRGSQLITEGTAVDPVVFTSSNDEGARTAGDWGGVMMLGEAVINITGGENQAEGIEATDDRAAYGGLDDESSCGHLKYTRVEFGGYELSLDNELNGITLAGCGSGTLLEYVQVHRGLDDGVEVFGGMPNLHHILVTATDDDGFDWDQGFAGNVQFLAVQEDPDVAGSADPNGIEADNNRDANDAEPRSAPTLYNVTLVGAGYSAGNGIVLRRGTWGTIRNAIITGFAASIDVRDPSSVAGTEEDPVALTVASSLFYENGGGTVHFYDESADAMFNDDNGFDEEAFFTDAAQDNVFDEDADLGDATNVEAPDLVPAAGSPAATGAATPTGAFFDESAEYMGAFEPGGADWTAGWTAYPLD